MKRKKAGLVLGVILGCMVIAAGVCSCNGSKTEDPSNDVENDMENDTGSAEASSSDGDSFIIPESDTRYIGREDMVPLGEKGWKMALYEIYARHGVIFSDPEVQKYFEGKGWYEGEIEEEDFPDELLNMYELKNVEVLENAVSMRTEEEEGMTGSDTEDMSVTEEGDTDMEMSGETYSADPQYYEENITTTITTNDYGDGWVSTEVDDDGNYFDEVVSGAWFDESGIPIASYPPDGLQRNVTWSLYDQYNGIIRYQHFDDPSDVDTIKRSGIDEKNTYSMLLKNIQKQTNAQGKMYIVGTEYYSNIPVVINGNFSSGLLNGDSILVFAKYTGLASDDTPNFQGFYIEVETGRF